MNQRLLLLTAGALATATAFVFSGLLLLALLRRLTGCDVALTHCRQAALHHPDSAHAHKGMATLLELRGSLEAAVEHSRAAVRPDPGTAFFRALLERAIARRFSRP